MFIYDRQKCFSIAFSVNKILIHEKIAHKKRQHRLQKCEMILQRIQCT